MYIIFSFFEPWGKPNSQAQNPPLSWPPICNISPVLASTTWWKPRQSSYEPFQWKASHTCPSKLPLTPSSPDQLWSAMALSSSSIPTQSAAAPAGLLCPPTSLKMHHGWQRSSTKSHPFSLYIYIFMYIYLQGLDHLETKASHFECVLYTDMYILHW